KAVIRRGTAASLLLVEQRLDQGAEPLDGLLGAEAGGADRDRVAFRRAEHHQAHDRGAADLVAVLLHLDRGIDLGGDGDELGARPGMEAALVPDLHRPGRHQAAASPNISEATEIYLRPASRAAATAERTSIVLRAPSSRISIGRLTPAITSILSDFIRLIARFEGVPPNRSVRMITPAPVSTA